MAREKSPYLLQHAHNPVDWFPWGEPAFAKARQENKPIFLSIGYSTCHWCHVMERESFEDEKTAKFLNEHFVSIKVDREERPDVDQIYMTFVQAMSGQGGWPLNVFLTPELKPFYGGTYFPPDGRYSRPSLMQVLQNISQLWKTRHGDVLNSAADLHQRLESHTGREATNLLVLTAEVLRNAARQFKDDYDPKNGGFGGAPKFPRPSEPAFLLRCGARFKDDESVRMVLHTCERMAAGGMYDQIGGGFHRYSVDAEWLVPHFEKMLYDNAQLVNLYLDACLVSGRKEFADVARDIIGYVLRDMTHPEGGFYSAEDADSEGKEGKFYCWTREELSKLLTPDEFKAAVRYFGVTEKGNFVDHSDPNPLPHQNVLSIVKPLPLLHSPEKPLTRPSVTLSPSDGEREGVRGSHENLSKDSALLTSAKKKMFEARSKRVRPHLDDKVLSSWNGLMLGALARAYAVLGDESYRAAAEKNLAFIQTNLWTPALTPSLSHPMGEGGRRPGEGDAYGTLYHRWRDGERDSVQLLDAYAFLLAGVFWQAVPDSPDLILRVKEDYDGAEPSGNSVAILALLKLGAITDRKDFKVAAEKSLRLFANKLHELPQAVPYLLLASDYWLEEPKRAVIVGHPNAADTRALIHAAHSVYQPNKVVLGNSGPVEPFAKTLPTKDAPVVFLCTGTACQPPTKDVAKIREMLK
ncbi:MAG: thioredoxin domain-containing protein [Verrucomicrobia bacterium]|nr:MAG: thioredoxin domain-containing protein [Verrucomicrobiota bacterium]